MTLPPRLAGLMAAAVLMLAPALAHASNPECLWRTVPAATQNQFLAAYDTGDVAKALDVLTESDEVLGTVISTCGLNEQTAQTGGKVLAAYAVRLGAARTLQAKYGVGSAALDRAWAARSREERFAFAASVESEPGMDMAFVNAVARSLNLSGDDALTQLRFWLAGNAMIMQEDGKY